MFFLHNHGQQKLVSYLPTAVTVFRLVALPFLVSLIMAGQVFLADFLFIIAISSDFADGYLARRMHISSRFGANLDVTVDALFVGGMFLQFVFSGVYPFWVLLVISFMYVQYVVTTRLLKTAFDPIGKYYGSLLYGAIGLTMLFNSQLAQTVILWSLVGVSILTLLSRLVYLLEEFRSNKDA